jgi:predicted ATPase
MDGIELRPLTVLLGANGSGKTSLLDVLRLLARSAERRTKDTLNDLGGLPSLLTRDETDSLVLAISAELPPYGTKPPLEYSLEIASYGQGYRLASEELAQRLDPNAPGPFWHVLARAPRIQYTDPDSGMLVQPDWEFDQWETALSQALKLHRQGAIFRRSLAGLASYAAKDLQLGPRSSIRMPQPMRPAELPGAAGEELVPCLYYLRENDRVRFEMIEDALSAAFPSFEGLAFPPVAAGTLAVTWKDRELGKAIYAHELSDGTLRFLWLVTLLSSAALPSITVIDEPEASLHPVMLRILADLFREASARTQLIVATHSESLVRFLNPDEILALEVEDGHTTARWGDSFGLDAWLEDYSLDQVWRLNRFGANP